MKTKVVDVKSKSKVVGQAQYPEFDSVSEAQSDLGEAKTLELINAQVRTNAMNVVRASLTGKPSKQRLTQEAMALITPEEFQGVAGDQARLQKLIDEKVAQLKAKYEHEAPEEVEDDADDEQE